MGVVTILVIPLHLGCGMILYYVWYRGRRYIMGKTQLAIDTNSSHTFDALMEKWY